MPSLIGTTVAANYLKAESPFTRFGTPELVVIKVVQTGVDATPSAANSLFSKSVRALQQTAEVYGVFAPVADGDNDYYHAIIVANTQTNGDTKPAGGLVDTGSGWGILETAIQAGSGVAATVTTVTL
jgi:hypothetical protein